MDERATGATTDEIPLPALLLGAAGLLPFVFGAAALVLVEATAVAHLPDATYFARVLVGYGAVILSFLGGVRWGAAVGLDMGRDEVEATPRSVEVVNALTVELVIAVLPSLIAWGALLLPVVPALALLAFSFVVLGFADRIAAQDGRLPAWYGRLRLWLTGGATASVLTGLCAVVLL